MNPFHNTRGRFAKSPSKSRRTSRKFKRNATTGRFSKYGRNTHGRFSPKTRRNMTRRRR